MIQKTESRAFYAEDRAIRRSRTLATFLVLNWVVMGFWVYHAGIRTLVGVIAFVFGLLSAIGGISQLRAGKLARQRPIAEIDSRGLRLRTFSAAEPTRIPWEQIKRLEGERSDYRLLLATGAYQPVPALSLSVEDKEALLEEIRRRVG